uniref:Superoxide dismutase [Cu-Zn] n=1 Tax=Strongyloides venezuelensis TaxID=75913 RepID=A0A0K0FUL3_STRVS
MVFLTVLILILPAFVLSNKKAESKIYLVTQNNTAPTKHIGTIKIKELNNGQFEFKGDLNDLPSGQHGFHIHQNHSIDNACIAAGAHLNLYNNTHGGLNSQVRHEGDLGNIFTDDKGKTKIDIKVNGLDFNSTANLLSRTLVVHQLVDDLGLGNNDASRTTGNSGTRIACGLIN